MLPTRHSFPRTGDPCRMRCPQVMPTSSGTHGHEGYARPINWIKNSTSHKREKDGIKNDHAIWYRHIQDNSWEKTRGFWWVKKRKVGTGWGQIPHIVKEGLTINWLTPRYFWLAGTYSCKNFLTTLFTPTTVQRHNVCGDSEISILTNEISFHTLNIASHYRGPYS